MDIDQTRSADALDFLRAGLTTAEREWPRFRLELQDVHTVPINELRTHPDLMDRVASVAPGDAYALTGAVVLVDDRGAIYAIGIGTHRVMFRVGPPSASDAEPREAIHTPRPPSMGGGQYTLPNDWLLLSPYAAVADPLPVLQAIAARARAFVSKR
jgi:hypothetical protein